MTFKLSIEQGKGRGQAFDFDSNAITIGRAEENDIVLYDEQGVSRRHARISEADGKFTVEDLDSANGTLLNGARVKKELLSDGDTIGIGAVVFRFGTGKATAKREDGSTRIVSLTKDAPRTNPRAELPLKPPPGSSSAGTPNPLAPNPLSVRIAMIVFGAAMTLAVVLVVVTNRSKSSTQKPDCESVIPYEDRARLVTLGNNSDAVCLSSTRLTFSFVPKGKPRVILGYSPFYTESGEVQVYVNKTKIEDAPLAPTRQAVRHEVTIPESALNFNQENTLAFVAPKGGEWGVERVELQFISQDDTNATAAEEAYKRGTRLYDQRHVAAANLYKSWLELRNARRLMEWITPRPAIYAATLELISKVEKELDRTCKDQLFQAQRETKYEHFEAANERYQYIFAAFPGEDHPCRYEAQQKIGTLNQLQQASGK